MKKHAECVGLTCREPLDRQIFMVPLLGSIFMAVVITSGMHAHALTTRGMVEVDVWFLMMIFDEDLLMMIFDDDFL